MKGNSPAIAVSSSQNSKLSTNRSAATTYASQHTCPKTCPFRGMGCYAELGHTGLITKRLNASPEINPVKIARIEAELIESMTGDQPLRLHTVGDCANAFSAMIIAQACKQYKQKFNMPVWTYTHARFPRKHWGDISVLRSCSTLEQAKNAVNANYAAALVVSEFKSESRYYLGKGLYGIPCPVQTKKCGSCVDCKLCFKDAWLQSSNNVILFEAHGCAKNRVKQIIEF